jgi:hypothetical protein
MQLDSPAVARRPPMVTPDLFVLAVLAFLAVTKS